MSTPDPATQEWIPLWAVSGGSPIFGSIPGEVKLWGGKTLPAQASYGKWVWADGSAYAEATYPVAAGHIAPEWKTAHGQADPGAGMFRVPDLRGLVPMGLDQMPGGARANRVTRSVSIAVAAKTGTEYHTITLPEVPAHAHGVTDPTHAHSVYDPSHQHALWDGNAFQWKDYGAPDGYGGSPWFGGNVTQHAATGISIYGAGTGISIQNAGGGGAHENMPPSVFVPYIVRLDG